LLDVANVVKAHETPLVTLQVVETAA
jgi:hypothetical protein